MNRGPPPTGMASHRKMSVGRPPGTATRLTTGMAGARQPVTGGGVALSAQVNVLDRPMTQQGLGGMKTGVSRGPQRQVQDKTYFMGVLRTKISELIAECGNLKAQSRNAHADQSTFLSYEKRAEKLANELKNYQNELGDYNTLVDKLTTDESIAEIQLDYEELRAQNERGSQGLDVLFEQRQQREQGIKHYELELEQEKSMRDTMISSMDPKSRQKYMEMQELNNRLLKDLERGQQQLDLLNAKKEELEDELAVSPVKQEAVHLYEALTKLEDKRNMLIEEQTSRGSPQEEREKLLKQVKEDNQEIATMERQTNEIKEKLGGYGHEMTQLNMDIEENQGERNQKYKELKKREETMDEFLDTYEEHRAKDIQILEEHEQHIVMILEAMSRNLKREDAMEGCGSQGSVRKAQDLANMRDDLSVKEGEVHRSRSTASGLAGEHEKLHQDLMKVEQLESKITTELGMLKERIAKMTSELVMYEDLDNLRTNGEKKKKELAEKKILLYRRKETFKQHTTQLKSEVEALKAQLTDNETYVQLGNLERKWQHAEQNNFVMQEFIASKQQECDYPRIAKKVNARVAALNNDTIAKLAKPGY